MDKVYVDALLNERASLVPSPARPARTRRIREIEAQLTEQGAKFEPVELADEDASDSTPRERAVPRTRG